MLDLHFDDLRHIFPRWLTMKGRPLKEVPELLGHKSITPTERYSHLAPERLREAVATLECRSAGPNPGDGHTSDRQHGRVLVLPVK